MPFGRSTVTLSVSLKVASLEQIHKVISLVIVIQEDLDNGIETNQPV